MLLSLPAREVKSYKTMKILETEVGYLNKKVNIAFIALTRPSRFFQKSLTEKHAHPSAKTCAVQLGRHNTVAVL